MTGNHAGVDGVLAEIVYDGCGFELRGAMTEGLDLLRKAERMAALGGKFIVTTVPSSGTYLKAEIPARPLCLTASGRMASQDLV